MKNSLKALFSLGIILTSLYVINNFSSGKLTLPTYKAEHIIEKPLDAKAQGAIIKLLNGAKTQLNVAQSYDPAYTPLPYPNGDVPIAKGVCSDVVVRAFRAAGLDLQQAVHEDMVNHFKAYPNRWGLTKPDPNIDHRRVPNLQTFFTRKGKALNVTYRRDDYRPGDIVTWDLNNYGLPHIGLVSDQWSETNQRYLIIHNIGQGAKLEDRLFDWRITGHYRYF